ncbi:MAG: type II secretion system protein N [Pseudomonadota bacterium]
MRRISVTTLSLLGALVFGASLIACAPASLIKVMMSGDRADFSYDRITGTLWRGEIANAVIAGAHAGAVTFSVDPLSFLTGAAKVSIVASGVDVIGDGKLKVSPTGALTVSDARLNVSLSALSRNYRFLGAPIKGDAFVTIETLKVSRREGCDQARGDVRTDILHGPADAYRFEAFDLMGPISCDDGSVQLALNGAGGEGSVDAVFALSPNMTYTIEATARLQRPEASRALLLFGFEEAPGGLTYASVGELTGI